MSHKLSNVLVHLVFGTKSREESIPAKLVEKLWSYLSGIGRNVGIPVLIAGGITDHVHILAVLPTETSIAKAVQVFKANSSRWIREQGHTFQWQEGYGAFSVSASNRNTVARYIAHQAEHHAKRTYEDEFSIMLKKSGSVPSLRDSADSH
jgi:REP element-mobilizing transposase RayT